MVQSALAGGDEQQVSMMPIGLGFEAYFVMCQLLVGGWISHAFLSWTAVLVGSFLTTFLILIVMKTEL